MLFKYRNQIGYLPYVYWVCKCLFVCLYIKQRNAYLPQRDSVKFNRCTELYMGRILLCFKIFSLQPNRITAPPFFKRNQYIDRKKKRITFYKVKYSITVIFKKYTGPLRGTNSIFRNKHACSIFLLTQQSINNIFRINIEGYSNWKCICQSSQIDWKIMVWGIILLTKLTLGSV